MTVEDVAHDHLIRDYLSGKLTRRQLFTAVGTMTVIAALPASAAAAGTTSSFQFFPQTRSGRYTTESVTEIVSNVLTWASFEVATSTFLLRSATLLIQTGLTGVPLEFVQAFNTEQQLQIDFWSSVAPDAAPRTTTFTLDPTWLPGPKEALSLFEVASTIRTALFVTAVREFAELGQPTLAKNAAQSLGLQAGERHIVRLLEASAGVASAHPPNNKAFETDLFLFTADAVAAMYVLNFIGGKGIAFSYPGRAAALAASGAISEAVVQRAPNNAGSSVQATGPAGFLTERS